MKKYLLVIICLVAVIASGCGIKKDENTSTAPNKKTGALMKDLSIAAMSGDEKKMNDITNDLQKEKVRPKELTINDTCVDLTYIYENKEQVYRYCK